MPCPHCGFGGEDPREVINPRMYRLVRFLLDKPDGYADWKDCLEVFFGEKLYVNKTNPQSAVHVSIYQSKKDLEKAGYRLKTLRGHGLRIEKTK